MRTKTLRIRKNDYRVATSYPAKVRLRFSTEDDDQRINTTLCTMKKHMESNGFLRLDLRQVKNGKAGQAIGECLYLQKPGSKKIEIVCNSATSISDGGSSTQRTPYRDPCRSGKRRKR